MVCVCGIASLVEYVMSVCVHLFICLFSGGIVCYSLFFYVYEAVQKYVRL